MTWCIDAWAVRDGLAFISEREPDSEQATVTVHVAPPWFDCTPIASRATALWATRGHFEEGFFLEGEEVGFGDLETAIEAVRRAYVVSGHGEPNGGVVPATPPLTPDGGGGADSPSHPPTPWWSEQLRKLSSIATDDDRKDVTKLLRSLFDESLHRDGAVLVLLRDTLAEMWDDVLDESRPTTVDRIGESVRLQHWLSALFRAGFLWSDLPEGMEVMIASRIADAPTWQPQEMIGAQRLSDLVFRTPLPRRLRRGRFATFGDVLSVVGSDRLFVAKQLDLEHLAVILLVAKLTAAAAASASFVGLRPDSAVMALHEEVLTNASEWIAEMLPDTRLEGHPAEELVARLWKEGGGTQEPAPLSPEPRDPSPAPDVTTTPHATRRIVQTAEEV
jgi:hypothetical protein